MTPQVTQDEGGAVSLGEYYDRLDRHDWFYEMSDDPGTYKKGAGDQAKVEAISKQSTEHAALYAAFTLHIFNGEPWGTEPQPKPERPK